MDKKFLFTCISSFTAGVFAAQLIGKFRNRKNPIKTEIEKSDVKTVKLIEPYCGENGKIEGLRVGNVVFALKDADGLMNFDRACVYCRKIKIAGKECTLPRNGLEKKIAPDFERINKELESIGGEPLCAIKTDHKGYWADTASGKRGPSIAPWIIGFDNASSDIYGGGELCHVRPVMYLEGE